MTTTTFDPAAYKETTREQWQDAAAAWHRWDPVFDRWLGEATQRMLDLAHVERRGRACSTSPPARAGSPLEAARRGAIVLATDISSNILDAGSRCGTCSGSRRASRPG